MQSPKTMPRVLQGSFEWPRSTSIPVMFSSLSLQRVVCREWDRFGTGAEDGLTPNLPAEHRRYQLVLPPEHRRYAPGAFAILASG